MKNVADTNNRSEQPEKPIFTNYVNHVAQTVADFPGVKLGNGQATTGTFDVNGGHNH
jgi:hypothetical protein